MVFMFLSECPHYTVQHWEYQGIFMWLPLIALIEINLFITNWLIAKGSDS